MRNYWIYPIRAIHENGTTIYDELGRKAAADKCQFCGKVIGWDGEVYIYGPRAQNVCHRACFEEHIRGYIQALKDSPVNQDVVQAIEDDIAVIERWLEGQASNEEFNLVYGVSIMYLAPSGSFISQSRKVND